MWKEREASASSGRKKERIEPASLNGRSKERRGIGIFERYRVEEERAPLRKDVTTRRSGCCCSSHNRKNAVSEAKYYEKETKQTTKKEAFVNNYFHRSI